MRSDSSLLACSTLALALALVLCSAQGLAQEQGATPNPMVMTEGFLSHHPDVKYRAEGLDAMERQDLRAAYTAFERASRYADKASQAMVAEMLWLGQGIAADRALAYAWMDLAAERGYQTFIIKREQYWAQLSAEEQQRAIDQGQEIYAEFGDAVAKPRLASRLARGRQDITGSRVGFVGALSIQVRGPTGQWMRIDGSEYYADRYWRVDDYFEWQDRVWSAPPTGSVSVGEMLSVSEPVSDEGERRK